MTSPRSHLANVRARLRIHNSWLPVQCSFYVIHSLINKELSSIYFVPDAAESKMNKTSACSQEFAPRKESCSNKSQNITQDHRIKAEKRSPLCAGRIAKREEVAVHLGTQDQRKTLSQLLPPFCTRYAFFLNCVRGLSHREECRRPASTPLLSTKLGTKNRSQGKMETLRQGASPGLWYQLAFLLMDLHCWEQWWSYTLLLLLLFLLLLPLHLFWKDVRITLLV